MGSFLICTLYSSLMLQQLYDRFAEAGLVFLMMAVIIYFLYKEFKRERSAKESAQQKHVDYVEKHQDKQIEIMTKISSAMDNLANRIK